MKANVYINSIFKIKNLKMMQNLNLNFNFLKEFDIVIIRIWRRLFNTITKVWNTTRRLRPRIAIGHWCITR